MFKPNISSSDNLLVLWKNLAKKNHWTFGYHRNTQKLSLQFIYALSICSISYSFLYYFIAIINKWIQKKSHLSILLNRIIFTLCAIEIFHFRYPFPMFNVVHAFHFTPHTNIGLNIKLFEYNEIETLPIKCKTINFIFSFTYFNRKLTTY